MLTFTLTDIETALATVFWPMVRILSMLSVAPVIGHRSIPVRAKIGLAALIAFAAAGSTPSVPALFDAYAPLILIQQMLIGFAMGFTVRLVFAAVELAGDMVGLQMGLSFATFVDPVTAGQTPLIGTFIGLCGMLMFLALDGHLLIIAGTVASFDAAPAGPSFFSGVDWSRLASLGAWIFALGLQMALPLLAAMLTINLTLGVMSRATPQLNLFSVGFPLTVLGGIILLTLFIPQVLAPLPGALQKSLQVF